jgi:hypothetical protein
VGARRAGRKNWHWLAPGSRARQGGLGLFSGRMVNARVGMDCCHSVVTELQNRHKTGRKLARGPACGAEFDFRLFRVVPSLNGQENRLTAGLTCIYAWAILGRFVRIGFNHIDAL